MHIAGYIMAGIEVAVDTLKIGRPVFTSVIKMGILSCLAEFRREEIFMALNAG
jgi:hypothetical protein